MPWTTTNTAKGDNKLYSDAKGVVPSLDLRFASQKNLNDYMTGTPLVDHQRSMFGSNLSPGTFVNSNGLIETAKFNALTANSEVFSTWILPSTSTATTTSPFNTTAASIDNASALSITVNDPSAVTFSGYFKQGSSRYVYLRSVNWGSVTRIYFDLQLGEFVRQDNPAAPVTDTFATSVGNGWYRCGFTLDSTGDSVGNLQITATDSSTNINSVGYVFAFGIQVEEGPVSTYIPTTTSASAAPRFDHDPTTGESLGLLIEESRTNKLTNSSTLVSFNPSSIVSKTPNAGIAPDGTNTAVLAATILSGIDPYLRAITTQAVNTTYTYSFFAKPGTVNYAVVYNIAKNGVGLTWFNVANGTIGTTASGVTPFIAPAGNGWYRVGVTLTTDATIANNLVDIRWSSVDSVLAPSVGDNLLVWGAQLEEGSFATSYIATTTTALTRSADVASITGSNFSSWYNQSESTAFIETVPKNYSLADLFMFGTNKNFNPSSWGTYQPGANNDYQFYGRISSAYDFNASINNSDAASKLSFGLSGTTYSASYDGNTVTTGSNSGVPTGINTLEFNKGVYNISSIYVKRFTYFPERLPDTTLQAITA